MPDLLFTDAEVAPGVHADLRVTGAVIGGRGVLPPATTDTVIGLGGRAVLPGLVDHHVHLLAVAAASGSIDCSATGVDSVDALVATVAAARGGQPRGWLRGIGYDVALAGVLDRTALDRAGAGPVRVQDRTATWWVLNTEGLDLVLPEDRSAWPDGVRVDAAGNPTGVLVRLDGWLRGRLGPTTGVVDGLAAVGQRLVAAGVTSVHDASATNGAEELALLDAAGLPMRLTAMTGGPDVEPVGSVALGPVKLVLDDADLPTLDALAGSIAAAHAACREVAIHCVTALQLLVGLAALEQAGSRPGDRIEHASVVPRDAVGTLRRLGVTVVTQPGLLWSRGDRYLDEVEDDDRDALYRIATLRRAGVRVLGSTDAPFGPADPWIGIRAAADRRTSGGRLVAPDELVGRRAAVDLFTAGHRVRPGQVADLCVLDATWAEVTSRPSVLATLVGGRQVHGEPVTSLSGR